MKNPQEEFAIFEKVLVDGQSKPMYIKGFNDSNAVVINVDGEEMEIELSKCHHAVSKENSGKTILLGDVLDLLNISWKPNTNSVLCHHAQTDNREKLTVYVPKTRKAAEDLFNKFKSMNLSNLDEEKFFSLFDAGAGNIGFCIRDNSWQVCDPECSLFNITVMQL